MPRAWKILARCCQSRTWSTGFGGTSVQYEEEEGDDQAMLRSELEVSLLVLRLDVPRRRLLRHGRGGIRHDESVCGTKEGIRPA